MLANAGGELGTPRELRVLIVDDNRDAADSLAALVRLWGHEAHTAYDGEAGFATACAFRPDCLLLDINMPRVDGYALARRLRQCPELKAARVLALSANAGDGHPPVSS